ncbi:Methyl-accepting chemotaxis protein I (serine chemoreceptor protein), partial [hydrothermal vent metagenome]
MKSLQAKLISMLAVMLVIALVLSVILVAKAMEENDMASNYGLKNKIAGYLNAAAGWQAIERGVGATILGSDSPSTSLISKFNNLGSKGDEEVASAMRVAKELIEIYPDRDFESQFSSWKSAYGSLQAVRSRVTSGSIKRGEWIPIASKNINAEFSMRNIAFAPHDDREGVMLLNAVTRVNVATLAEFAGRERAILGGTIAGGKPILPATKETLVGYRALVDNASKAILAQKNLSGTPGELSAAISAYEAEFLGGYQQLREKVYSASAKGEAYPVSGGEWIGAATKAINTVLNISKVVGDIATVDSDRIKSGAHTDEILSLGLLALSVGVFIFIFFFLTRSVIKPINISITTLGEGAGQIESASGQVSSSSQMLAEGATEQASSLEETSSALDQMASMTKQNADNANEASALAKDLMKEAEKGGDIMNNMSVAMDEITKSSDEIRKINKVIEEIAFQTNLLALNAAVEAARAGEHGKGFAVVAEEVRNLAQRSASAAKDTSSLIEESGGRVESGSSMAAEANHAIVGMLDNVKKVTDLVGEIASASNEQAQGIDQVNNAVSQMDRVTQQNAANAEQSAAASEELSAQAESLNDVVRGLMIIVSGVDSTGMERHGSPSGGGRKQLAGRAPVRTAP